MLDIVIIDGAAKGIVVRNLLTGEIEKYSAHAVVLATGGYSNVFFLSTNAMNCNATAIWRAHKRGAYFANPCFRLLYTSDAADARSSVDLGSRRIIKKKNAKNKYQKHP